MKNRVITISREFGSGGRTIGKKTAERLGIPCYDAEILQEMEKETGFAADYVKEAGEYAPGSFLSSAFSNRVFGPTNEDILWEHQYKVITNLAAKGPCVIVGRCADYILRESKPARLFVYADMDSRVRRCMERSPAAEKLTDREIRRQIQRLDKNRADYYEYYTDSKWGDMNNYDLCVNTAGQDIKELARRLAKLF